jgi:hypothetical protein
MSETIEHTRLVAVVVNWVTRHHQDNRGLCIYCDCPTVLQTEKPSPIEGYFPDLYAATTPPTITIIGEAKTIGDLETQRSLNQFLAFIRFLSVRPNPTLILATPWRGRSTAMRIINTAIANSGSQHIKTHFLAENQDA